MRFWSFLFLSFCLVQCASYANNRRKDAQDVITLGVEKPMYGFAVQIGPIPIGALFLGGESELGKSDKGEGFGNRGGDFGKYRSQQLVYLFLGGASFISGEPMKDDKGKELRDKKKIWISEEERANIKSFRYRYFSFFSDPIKDRKKRKKETFKREFVQDIIKETGNPAFMAYLPEADPKPFGYPSGTSWKVEATIGLYGGVRAGFNVAEFVDFLLGWTTFDLLDDDIYGKEESYTPPLPILPDSEEAGLTGKSLSQ